MKEKTIEKFIEAFAKTAKMCKEAGVDGVEIHAVHEGYLLDQFTLPYVNKREDSYGGSLENRARFAVEIVKAIKKECGQDYPVSLRYSVVSKTKGFRMGALPDERYEEVGRDMEESIALAKILIEAGYDMLNCDNGTYDAWYWSHPPIYMKENCNMEEVVELGKHVNVPLVCAGRMDPETAAKAIEKGEIDAMGVARQFLADPMWIKKLADDKEEEIRPCICCHNACFTMCHYEGTSNDQPLSDTRGMARCAINAETMQSKIHYIEKTKHPKKVAIIGGGMGGLEAARVLALRGHTPIIYEKSDRLGGVFYAASRASFKGKLRDLLAWQIRQVEKLGIEIHFNTEIRRIEEIKADAYIVATGSKAKRFPLPGISKAIEATDYLLGKEVGEKVAVIGGGLTGCEIAYELSLQGKSPIIIEAQDDLVKQRGVCLANSSYLRDYFALNKTPVYLNSKLKAVKDKSIVIDNKGKEKEIEIDSVILAMGYFPTPIFQGKKKVQWIGDCAHVGNLRNVIWDAYEAAMAV